MAAEPLPLSRLLLGLPLLLGPLLGSLLLLLPPPSLLHAAGPGLGRRFAERKLCADPECTLLMYRGKAMRDFQGPDCRFVNFKKGEAVYVYYKLIGKITELWAGSVGNDFGYFPKDLLEINHDYSEEEVELPTDETDFVCFDSGRDDFDNYNVDELLKSLQETTANGGETEPSDPGTKPAAGVGRHEEIEQAGAVKSLDALETDNPEPSTADDKEAIPMPEEADSSLPEGTANTGGDSSAHSHNANSQGDQTAHEHLKGMLHGKLKGLEYENTKNTNIPQVETSQLDQENEEVHAYTLLNRELSGSLQTKLGSTADAVVSDDEVTRLVTCPEEELEEGRSTDPPEAEEEPGFADEPEELPLLSFMAEEEMPSLVDLEGDGNQDAESQSPEPDEGAKGATELHNQRETGEEPDSDAFIKDAFTESKKLDGSLSVDRSEYKQTKEKQDEVVLISKREASDTTQSEHLSKELLRKEPGGTGDVSPQGNTTEQSEEQLTTDGTDSHSGELKRTALPDPHLLPSPGQDLESKAVVKSKQDASKPSVSDINKSPVLLSQIERGEKKVEDDTLEEVLEKDVKHKRLWEKTKEKQRAEDKPSDNVPAKSVEEVKNESQSDLEYTHLLKEKLEHGMPAVEKEIPRYEEGLKQAGETDHGNPKTTSLKKEPEMNMRNMKETLAGQGDPSPGEAVRQSRPWENEYSEPDVKEELSRNLGKMTAFEESIEQSSPEEKSERAAQNTNRDNLTQQGTAHSGDADSDRNLGTELPKARTELQPEEPDAEENSGPKQGEEELLEDENAASAKLSQARAAHVQGDPLHVRSANPELEALSKAVSESTDEAGEEINSFTEEAKKLAGSKEAEVPGSEDAKWHEVGHMVEDPAVAAEPFEAEEPPAVQEHPVQSPDTQADFNQSKNHIPEGISQKHSQEVQTSEHPGIASQQSAGFPSPADSPAGTGEPGSDLSESVRRLPTIRAFLDQKRVLRLHKYLGLQQVLRIEAMLHDMQVEMELAGKAGPDSEELEKALDQILEFSESSVLDFVGKVLDSRVVENKEEVVKEMDLYDEESALMDDIQELIYSLRTKYSSASESVPLASAPEQREDQLHLQDGAKQAEPERVSIRNPSASGESNQEFHQPEEKRPEQPLEEEEERAVDAQPQHEEANFLDGREAEENNSERGSLLEDSSFGSTGAGQSAREDTAAAPDEDEGRPAGGREEPAEAEPATEDEPAKGAEPAKGDEPAASSRGALSGAGAARELLRELVAALPEEIRPGPDFHGIPWEPVIVTALVGIATLAIMFWRTCLAVKSRIYQVTEKQLAEKIKNLLQEKSEILDKISKYDQKIKEAKESVKVAQEQKDILSDETAGLKDTVKELKEANRQLDDKVKNLHTMLETETKKNEKKQNKLSEAQKAMERLQESISAHSAELSEVQIALNEAKLSEEKVKSELHHVQEENARLKKSKEQLLKEAEGWSERHTELSEQIKLYQKSQKDIEETLAYKETEIEVLTNCIMQLKQLDMDSASEAKKNAEGCGWSPGHELANGELPDNDGEKMKSQIKQMMDVSRVKAKLSIVEEDRNLLQSKLNDEVAARHELEEQIKKLEHDSCSLKSAKDRLETECRTLQQKVEILGELYQQKEMALQKKLTQEEYERQEKEQKLSAADEKAVLAIEELKVYKQRIQDMEEELQQTERSYKNQIAAHEKKAHDNWLIARSAERALAEEKREAANLRQKLIEVNQKLIMLQRPLIVKPTPGRPTHQVPPRRGPLSRDGSFGPSPVSGGNPSPTQLSEVPPRPLSAPRREGSRGEFGSVVDGPPVPQRPPELPGRMSVPDLRLAVASVIGDGPRTSSPSTAVDGVAKVVPKGPPPFPGTAGISSPVLGPPPPLPVRYGPPGAAQRLHFGPPRVRGAPLPAPAVRDFFPGPPLGMRDVPPGPLPPPPDPRGYGRGHPPFQPLGPPGPRDHPPGPWLPPPGSRDYTPSPNRDLPPAGPRDHPAAPPKDSTQPPVQKP